MGNQGYMAWPGPHASALMEVVGLGGAEQGGKREELSGIFLALELCRLSTRYFYIIWDSLCARVISVEIGKVHEK